MRKIALFSFLFCSCIVASPSLTLINKTNETLHFTLYENTQEVFPELPTMFDLENQGQLTIRNFNFATYDSGYIHGEITEDKNVFFAIDKDFVIHGYIGAGIAYSWSYEPATIIFCTPQEYSKYDRCI